MLNQEEAFFPTADFLWAPDRPTNQKLSFSRRCQRISRLFCGRFPKERADRHRTGGGEYGQARWWGARAMPLLLGPPCLCVGIAQGAGRDSNKPERWWASLAGRSYCSHCCWSSPSPSVICLAPGLSKCLQNAGRIFQLRAARGSLLAFQL